MNAHAHVKARAAQTARALGWCMPLRGLARLRAHAHGRGRVRRLGYGRGGGAVEPSGGRRRSARAVRAIGGTCGDMRVVVVVGKSVVVVDLGSDRNRRVGGW